jgi:hypothetical protein
MKTARLIYLVLPMMLTGCFTGVESTPRITAYDVKKQKVVVTEEQKFLSNIAPEQPSRWRAGKRFRVTDNKISIIFNSSVANIDSLSNSDIYFQSFVPATSLTGNDATDVILTDRHGSFLSYRVNIAQGELDQKERLEIPFTVEYSVVEGVDSIMRGQKYYITTPLWYDHSLHSINGLRHIAVNIESVTPGNHVYPLAVNFKLDKMSVDQEEITALGLSADSVYTVFMTIGAERSSTRNFDAVFSFTNPRKKYPNVDENTWSLIEQSKVIIGMNRDECRLALGAPRQIDNIPTSSVILERWSYDDGVFLIFEDGILTRFRR